MCKIIPFPVQESTGFINLKQFFEVSGTVKTTEFYLGTAEELAKQNKITQSELLTLRRIGRQKLKALESQTAAPVAAPGLYMYTPEMGQEKPECQIDASLSYYGDHWFLTTKLSLKGRGIRLDKAENDTNYYIVTERAFEKLKTEYSISKVNYLD